MKQKRKTIGATKTTYPIADRREPIDELAEQIDDLLVKQENESGPEKDQIYEKN